MKRRILKILIGLLSITFIVAGVFCLSGCKKDIVEYRWELRVYARTADDSRYEGLGNSYYSFTLKEDEQKYDLTVAALDGYYATMRVNAYLMKYVNNKMQYAESGKIGSDFLYGKDGCKLTYSLNGDIGNITQINPFTELKEINNGNLYFNLSEGVHEFNFKIPEYSVYNTKNEEFKITVNASSLNRQDGVEIDVESNYLEKYSSETTGLSYDLYIVDELPSIKCSVANSQTTKKAGESGNLYISEEDEITVIVYASKIDDKFFTINKDSTKPKNSGLYLYSACAVGSKNYKSVQKYFYVLYNEN